MGDSNDLQILEIEGARTSILLLSGVSCLGWKESMAYFVETRANYKPATML